MSARFGASAYFPDRTPTWTEVVIGVLAAVAIIPDFRSPSATSWPAVILGFLAFAVALGPAANTSLGERIGRWFREIGVAGRAAVIILFAITVGVTFRMEAVPDALIADAASGGMLAIVLYLIAYVAWAGEVSGWTVDRDSTD